MILQQTNKRSPICLDIGSRQIKAVQMQYTNGRWQVAAQSVIRKTPDEIAARSFDGQRLRGILQRQGFTGDKVLVLPPVGVLRVSPLELPRNTQGPQRDQVARVEFARENRIDGDAFEMAWWPLPEPGRATGVTHALAVGIEHEDVTALLDELQRAGLIPVRVDAAVSAYMDVVAHHPDGGRAIDAVVDIGWDETRIGVLVEGKAVYERRIAELGLRHTHEQLRQRHRYDEQLLDCLLDSNHAGAEQVPANLVQAIESRMAAVFNRAGDETRVAMEYAQHRYPQHELGWAFVIGGAAELPGCIKSFSQNANVRAALVRPQDLTRGDSHQTAATGGSAGTLSTAAILSEVA